LRPVAPRTVPGEGSSPPVADAGDPFESTSPLPAEFDPDFYRSTYVDLTRYGSAELADHWRQFGIAEGRVGSAGATREGFLRLLQQPASLLEIGPLANPLLRGPAVRYFDVLPTDKLREKAAEHGFDASLCPEIDYYDEHADLGVISDRFEAVVSSHAIEHQPDLIKHLCDVGDLLEPGGLYFLAIPDHRYCFDHFLAPSTIADVLDANMRHARLHSATNVINMRAMITHNDAGRHWSGDHGDPYYVASPKALLDARDFYENSGDTYLDTHAWRFTPADFREICKLTYELGLSPLAPARVYETVRGSLEFYAVLELEGSGVSRI